MRQKRGLIGKSPSQAACEACLQAARGRTRLSSDHAPLFIFMQGAGFFL
jgi:hypothetical protein